MSSVALGKGAFGIVYGHRSARARVVSLVRRSFVAEWRCVRVAVKKMLFFIDDDLVACRCSKSREMTRADS
jgi:hypothetical protein